MIQRDTERERDRQRQRQRYRERHGVLCGKTEFNSDQSDFKRSTDVGIQAITPKCSIIDKVINGMNKMNAGKPVEFQKERKK